MRLDQQTLFPVGRPVPLAALPALEPRVQVPVRNQVEMNPADLGSLKAPEHEVRLVWAFVEKADLSGLRAAAMFALVYNIVRAKSLKRAA